MVGRINANNINENNILFHQFSSIVEHVYHSLKEFLNRIDNKKEKDPFAIPRPGLLSAYYLDSYCHTYWVALGLRVGGVANRRGLWISYLIGCGDSRSLDISEG
jgi:hypothetical protein